MSKYIRKKRREGFLRKFETWEKEDDGVSHVRASPLLRGDQILPSCERRETVAEAGKQGHFYSQKIILAL